jgi:CpeT protein
MHRTLARTISFATFLTLVAGCAQLHKPASPAPAASAQRSVAGTLSELQATMVGSFSSEAQAAADPEFRDIRLHMAPIWSSISTPESRWLYVEQAVSTAMAKPYRQRIYHLRPGTLAEGPGTIVSEVYEIPSTPPHAPLNFAGAWANPAAFDTLTPQQLVSRAGCDVVLRRVGPNLFEGGTVGTGCTSTLQGASYATSEAHIDASGLRTWDRGFDAQGNHVWGAVKGPYHFVRQPQ